MFVYVYVCHVQIQIHVCLQWEKRYQCLSPQIWVKSAIFPLEPFITAIRHTRSFRGLELWGCRPSILWPSRYSTQFWCMNWNVLQIKEGQTLLKQNSKLPPKFWKQMGSNRNKQTRLILARSRNCLLENSQRRVVLGYVLGDECRGETHVHFLPPSLYLGDIAICWCDLGKGMRKKGTSLLAS